MLRLTTLLLASQAVIGCTSMPVNDMVADENPELRTSSASPEANHTVLVAKVMEVDRKATHPSGLEPLSIYTPAEPTVTLDPPSSAPLQSEETLHGSRWTIKGGVYSADADVISDDGWIVNASWMRFFSKLFALELEVGYLDASGDDSGIDTDIWGIPLMVNGRLNLPVWVLDLYGGLGAGTIYYDIEAEAGGLTAEDDGFLLAGNAFLGATINLADSVALGLEAKYYLTEDMDDVDEPLDAFAVMLTLGFSR